MSKTHQNSDLKGIWQSDRLMDCQPWEAGGAGGVSDFHDDPAVFPVLPPPPPPPLCPSSRSRPRSPRHLVGPGVFAQGSALWNVNTGLCVKPEEPIFTGDKTPPTPGEEEEEVEEAGGQA